VADAPQNRWQQIEELFHRASECPAAERADRLAEWCGGDVDLRAEVESLLVSLDAAADSAEEATAPAEAPATAETDPWIGRTVGAYRIESLIGRGGMGAVYFGRRVTGDFELQIAFKLVATRFHSPWLRERFLVERQALANLNHPNIARLIDGGVTEEGEPYLVMEHIEGVRLDEYCERTGASVTAIVRLALELCDAVSFVHRNLIVHRDLKPGNVLVNAEGRVKLLDFGAAKLLDASEGHSEATRLGFSAFTPQYASPEQILGDSVTAASDVYSLGVILYRLFTGRLPREVGLSSAGMVETFDADPVTPADAVTRAVSGEAPSEAGQSEADLALRRSQLRGDLDAIVLKALRPKIEERYASVDALSADLRNYLEHRPVSARKAGFGYLARKLARRHAIAITAAASIALALAVGLVAVRREARIAALEELRAREGFGAVRRLSNLLLFDFYDKVKQLRGSTDVQRRLVAESLAYLDGLSRGTSGGNGGAGDPGLQLDLVEAYTKMGNVLGNPYEENLGDAPQALAILDKALRIAEDVARQRPGDPVAIRRLDVARRSIAEVRFSTGDTAGAIRYSRLAAESFDALAERPDAALADIREAASTFDSLGDLYGMHTSSAVGDFKEALECYTKGQSLQRKALTLAPGDIRATRGMAISQMKISNVLADTQPTAALAGYQKALDYIDQLPPEAKQSALTRRVISIVRRKMSGVYTDLGRPVEAIPYLESARDSGAALAARDPSDMRIRFDVATVEFDLAQTYEAAGREQAALTAYRDVALRLEQLLTHEPDNLVWLGHRSEALYRIGAINHDARVTREAIELALKVARSPEAAPDDWDRAAGDLLESDPKTAIDFAARAVEKSGGSNPTYLLTLAKAQKAGGEVRGAQQTAAKILAIIPAPGPGEAEPRLRREARGI
jgi:serine/threonine protein kinase